MSIRKVPFEMLEVGQIFYIQIGFVPKHLRKVDAEHAENTDVYLKLGGHCLVELKMLGMDVDNPANAI